MKKLNPKLKAGCGVIFVFGLGLLTGLVATVILIGTFVHKAENWRTRESEDFHVNYLSKELSLDKGQVEKLRPIIVEVLDRRWEMRKNYLLEDHEMLEVEYFPRIAQFLTEAQKQKGRHMLKTWRNNNGRKLRRPEDEPEEIEQLETPPSLDE